MQHGGGGYDKAVSRPLLLGCDGSSRSGSGGQSHRLWDWFAATALSASPNPSESRLKQRLEGVCLGDRAVEQFFHQVCNPLFAFAAEPVGQFIPTLLVRGG